LERALRYPSGPDASDPDFDSSKGFDWFAVLRFDVAFFAPVAMSLRTLSHHASVYFPCNHAASWGTSAMVGQFSDHFALVARQAVGAYYLNTSVFGPRVKGLNCERRLENQVLSAHRSGAARAQPGYFPAVIVREGAGGRGVEAECFRQRHCPVLSPDVARVVQGAPPPGRADVLPGCDRGRLAKCGAWFSGGACFAPQPGRTLHRCARLSRGPLPRVGVERNACRAVSTPVGRPA
jgi:hypothetical protein